MVPPDTLLTERHGEIPAWDEIDADMKPVLVRQIEVYAGFLEHMDHHLGQLVDGLADLEILDNTLIYYILGDNGASAEGSLQGTFNKMITRQGFGHLETADYLRERIDSDSRSPWHSIDDSDADACAGLLFGRSGRRFAPTDRRQGCSTPS